MERFTQSSTFLWRLFIVLVLTCLAIGVLVISWSRPRQAPFILLRQRFQMPVPLRDRVERMIPATPAWAWAWRLEEAVFGQRKAVNIFAEVVALADSPATPFSLPLGPPSFSDPNGLQVWLLSTGQLKVLRSHLEPAGGTDPPLRPRISTADGVECQMFQGQSVLLGGSTNQVGCSFGCYARVYPDSTDLQARITLSELVTNETVAPGGSSPLSQISVQTNLDTAVRLQIPKGSGIVLFDKSSHDSGRKPVAVIIDPPQPKM